MGEFDKCRRHLFFAGVANPLAVPLRQPQQDGRSEVISLVLLQVTSFICCPMPIRFASATSPTFGYFWFTPLKQPLSGITQAAVHPSPWQGSGGSRGLDRDPYGSVARGAAVQLLGIVAEATEVAVVPFAEAADVAEAAARHFPVVRHAVPPPNSQTGWWR